MQIKLFTIPIFNNEIANEELNKFMRTHRVLEIKQEFASSENGSYWCFSVKYIEGENINNNYKKREKIDYRTILDEATFKVFSKLREHRKEISKNDAIPAYAVFTDAELSEISKLEEITEQNVKKIKGIGEKKTEKYGKLIADLQASVRP